MSMISWVGWGNGRDVAYASWNWNMHGHAVAEQSRELFPVTGVTDPDSADSIP